MKTRVDQREIANLIRNNLDNKNTQNKRIIKKNKFDRKNQKRQLNIDKLNNLLLYEFSKKTRTNKKTQYIDFLYIEIRNKTISTISILNDNIKNLFSKQLFF